jgi:hypothetical protein
MPRGSRSAKRTSAAAAAAAAAAVKAEPAVEDAVSNIMAIDDNDVDMSAVDEDPVVREIDVYISPELASTAALVQYPLRPSSFVVGGKPNTKFHPSAARTKPRHSMLELDYAVPVSTGHYSYHDVEEIDGTRTFSSTAVPISTHMALGKLDDKGDRLDLIPLHTVLQMRPTFSHIDAVDPQQVAAAEQKAAEAQAAQQQQAAAGTKPLLFKRKESDRAATARRQSFAHLKSEQDAEEWIELQVVGGEDRGLNDGDDDGEPRKDAVLDRVACKHRSHIIRLSKTVVGGNIGYVNSLNYLPMTMDLTGSSDAASSGNTAAETNLNSIITPENVDKYKADLTTRLATLLTSSGGIPVPYPVFRSQYVGQELDPATGRVANVKEGCLTEEMLIDCLSATAALVRGNFVLKSSLCGLSVQVAEARDVALAILNKHGKIRRQTLLKALTETAEGEAMDEAIITEHLINQLLEPVATRGQNAMVLRVPDDETFVARFPVQSQQHQTYWEKRGEALAVYLSAYEELEDLAG